MTESTSFSVSSSDLIHRCFCPLGRTWEHIKKHLPLMFKHQWEDITFMFYIYIFKSNLFSIKFITKSAFLSKDNPSGIN